LKEELSSDRCFWAFSFLQKSSPLGISTSESE
jgi:hypothetical protein